MSEARELAKAARLASRSLAAAGAATRTKAIELAAHAIDMAREEILAANVHDLERGQASGLSNALMDRLLLTDERIDGIVAGMRKVAAQEDPIGEVVGGHTLDSGIRLTRVRVPLGVVAIVYEARPNVTADAVALTLRSGNACVLRGGSAAHDSCVALVNACRKGIEEAGFPADCATLIQSTDRAETIELMHTNGLVDVLIPRGGHSLIRTCVEQATVPVIETGEGNCHTYVHASADQDMALSIIENAKTSRPGVCNACESVLVDVECAESFLPRFLKACTVWGVLVHGDEATCKAAAAAGLTEEVDYVLAGEEDWGREYLALEISCKVVSGIDEAIAHINRYGTGHSECIVARDVQACERFLSDVDAAAVYTNASTRFTDGGMFGLGAEIGISTQRLHVRGPMGAAALTTTKCLLRGEGQVR